MAQRIRKDDIVKVIAGPHKGTTGKVLAVMPKESVARIEGIGIKSRNIKPSQLNPYGGKKDIHEGISLHKLALVVDEKTMATSRIGHVTKTDGVKTRVARQLKNKEIK